MPITKSAKKALRVSLRKREQNLLWKNKVKLLLKKSRQAVAKKSADASKLVAETIKTLDKAAKRNIIHKNKAARLKSRLMTKLNKSFGKDTKLPKVTVVVKQTEKPKPKKVVAKPAKKEPKAKKPTKKPSKKTVKK